MESYIVVGGGLAGLCAANALAERLDRLDAAGVILAVPPRAVEQITGRRLPKMRPVRRARCCSPALCQ